MAGESERQDLGKILVSALERISNLRDLPSTLNGPSTSLSPSPNSCIATEMARLFPSLNARNNSSESDSEVNNSVAVPQRQKRYCKSCIQNRKRTNPDPQKRGKNKAIRTTKTSVAKVGKPVNKDLVFIPNKNISTVPTHKNRVELESQGYIIHGFPFRRQWSEVELKCEIVRQFPELEITGFQFLKVRNSFACPFLLFLGCYSTFCVQTARQLKNTMQH